jgi:hypothetical protein
VNTLFASVGSTKKKYHLVTDCHGEERLHTLMNMYMEGQQRFVRLSFLQAQPPHLESPNHLLEVRYAKATQIRGAASHDPCYKTVPPLNFLALHKNNLRILSIFLIAHGARSRFESALKLTYILLASPMFRLVA